MPFLQNASNLHELLLNDNNIQSEVFNELFRALRGSPIKHLNCDNCGIEAIQIDSDCSPKHLTTLRLNDNSINAEGCRGLAKLLQGRDSTITEIHLHNSNIDNEGVAILVDALQNNTSLKMIDLSGNGGISKEGQKLCLKLVNDVSSIKAALQSNNSLKCIRVEVLQSDEEIEIYIGMATSTNRNYEGDPEVAGRAKVIQTHLNSGRRAELADLLGVHHSLYSEINPLHLPEVLSLVGHSLGQGELYVALKASIA